ncbi:hypothetical protein [Streptomyces sp. ME109]|uniref:hypothetical protein n=1 Tax=Streptomyces sp. me109 TaxID=1827853 RepID=UPI0011CD9890|nr:hypothetical protein [Streptomyces sp. me109]
MGPLDEFAFELENVAEQSERGDAVGEVHTRCRRSVLRALDDHVISGRQHGETVDLMLERRDSPAETLRERHDLRLPGGDAELWEEQNFG